MYVYCFPAFPESIILYYRLWKKRGSERCFCKQKPFSPSFKREKITPVGRKSKAIIMKNQGGRPRKTDSQLRKKVVSTRLTEPEYDEILKGAKKCRLSLSDFAHKILTNHKLYPRLSEEENDILHKLAGQSNNLNQLTKLAHINGIESILPLLSKFDDIIIKYINLLSDDRKNNTG